MASVRARETRRIDRLFDDPYAQAFLAADPGCLPDGAGARCSWQTGRPPTLDLCSITGRARLSYRRAAELFEHATRPLTQAHGWTLHQLRHSALTHDAEAGTNTPMLHALPRALRPPPGPEALARHAAATDPARRRQH